MATYTQFEVKAPPSRESKRKMGLAFLIAIVYIVGIIYALMWAFWGMQIAFIYLLEKA